MVSKEDAKKAYGERKVRKLYAVEGREATDHFLSADRIFEALTTATNIQKCFITFDNDNFGIYEIQEDR